MESQAERDVRRDNPDTGESPRSDSPGKPGRLFTAKMRHDHLKAALQNWDTDSEADETNAETVPIEQIPSKQPVEFPSTEQSPQPARQWGGFLAGKRSTIVKSAVALLCALVLGWLPVQRLLTSSSAEAVINGRVITVRTPISGDVHALSPRLEVGATVKAGDELMTIENLRSDRSNVDNLKRSVDQLTTDVDVLKAKEAVLNEHHIALIAQSERYRSGRIAVLEKQLGEIDTQMASAEAQHKELAPSREARPRSGARDHDRAYDRHNQV